MSGDEFTDTAHSWSRQREEFHRARALRLLLPGIVPLVVVVLFAGGALERPGTTTEVLGWAALSAVYAAVWGYLIRDARRFVERAAELDERYRQMTGDDEPAVRPLPFTPPSYPVGAQATGSGPVIAVSGRRIDPNRADVARFPLASVGEVRERLGELFARLRPRAVVSSAACGADLLALDAAQSLGIRRVVVLPFERSRFRHTSVTDRPGNWGRLYDRLLDAVAPADLVVLEDAGPERVAYRAAADAILERAHALALARAAGSPADIADAEVIALVVWEGWPRGSDDLTAWFRDEAVRRGIPIEQVSTL